jgi:thiol-disulfide isomerase/thioredoxin
MADVFSNSIIGHLQRSDFTPQGDLIRTNIQDSKVAAGNLPIFVLVYGNYCGHCTSAKPAFSKAYYKHHGKTAFFAVIRMDEEDDANEMKLAKDLPDILAARGIKFEGVPTYLVFMGGKVIEFDKGRKFEDIDRYLSSLQ